MKIIQHNLAIITIGVAILIGLAVPLDDVVEKSVMQDLQVPQFKVPKEIQVMASNTPEKFPPINKQALLGTTVLKPELAVATGGSQPERKMPVKSKKTPPRLYVKAIMIDGTSRVANINGAMMKVGGRIYKQRVLQIEEDKVILDGPYGKKVLRVN